MDFGHLYPAYWNIFEPNTTFKGSSIIQCRTMPMLAPIMAEVNVYSYWFQVPLRLLMKPEDYENFITGGREGNIEVNVPKYSLEKAFLKEYGQDFMPLLDALDIPIYHFMDTASNVDRITFDAFALRAYYLIWQHFFRDENTTAETLISTFTGTRYDTGLSEVDVDMFKLKSRCWTKDYFTSALPWAQRGGNVNMPFTALTDLVFEGTQPTLINTVGNDPITVDSNIVRGDSVPQTNRQYTIQDSNAGEDLQIDVTKNTKATTSIVGTINDLRRALTLQRWKERNAVGGSRYIEQINAHFGVWADDYRLQRPQYLGGSHITLLG